jgi:hypothetical protein
MNLRGFRVEIWKGGSVFVIILAEGSAIEREIPVGAESRKNSTCARLRSPGRGSAQADLTPGEPATLAICETRLRHLHATSQSQNDDDQQDQTESAAGVVAPSGAVWPGGKRTKQQQDQNHQQDCSHWDLPSDNDSVLNNSQSSNTSAPRTLNWPPCVRSSSRPFSRLRQWIPAASSFPRRVLLRWRGCLPSSGGWWNRCRRDSE